MNILTLIKKRKSIRKYQNRQIAKSIINKIIESGRWGSSVHGIQPWKFIIIRKKSILKKITDILLKKRKKLGILSRMTLHSSANAIINAQALILICNTNAFTSWVMRCGDIFEKRNIQIAKLAEISAIAAAIQNMVLTADYLGLSSCWHDSPLLYRQDIEKFFDIKDELVAILTLGYAAEAGKRSIRKSTSTTVRFIE